MVVVVRVAVVLMMLMVVGRVDVDVGDEVSVPRDVAVLDVRAVGVGITATAAALRTTVDRAVTSTVVVDILTILSRAIISCTAVGIRGGGQAAPTAPPPGLVGEVLRDAFRDFVEAVVAAATKRVGGTEVGVATMIDACKVAVGGGGRLPGAVRHAHIACAAEFDADDADRVLRKASLPPSVATAEPEPYHVALAAAVEEYRSSSSSSSTAAAASQSLASAAAAAAAQLRQHVPFLNLILGKSGGALMDFVGLLRCAHRCWLDVSDAVAAMVRVLRLVAVCGAGGVSEKDSCTWTQRRTWRRLQRTLTHRPPATRLTWWGVWSPHGWA